MSYEDGCCTNEEILIVLVRHLFFWASMNPRGRITSEHESSEMKNERVTAIKVWGVEHVLKIQNSAKTFH